MSLLFEIPCVILCGGKSSRMGEDKALLPFANAKSLSEHQFNRLKPYFKDIYISSKIDKFSFLKKECNNLILDENKIYSPIVALQTILKKVNSSKVFIITVDTPLVELDTIHMLIKNSLDFDITVAKTKKVHNLCGVFNKSCLNLIEEMIDNDIHKVGYLLQRMNTKYIEFIDDNEFINLNEKEEYLRAKELVFYYKKKE